MTSIARALALLLLAGCCDALFRGGNFVTRIHNVADLVQKLRITEVELGERLSDKLNNEGFSYDFDIKPQRGILVVHATPRAQTRIDVLLLEMSERFQE